MRATIGELVLDTGYQLEQLTGDSQPYYSAAYRAIDQRGAALGQAEQNETRTSPFVVAKWYAPTHPAFGLT